MVSLVRTLVRIRELSRERSDMTRTKMAASLPLGARTRDSPDVASGPRAYGPRGTRPQWTAPACPTPRHRAWRKAPNQRRDGVAEHWWRTGAGRDARCGAGGRWRRTQDSDRVRPQPGAAWIWEPPRCVRSGGAKAELGRTFVSDCLRQESAVISLSIYCCREVENVPLRRAVISHITQPNGVVKTFCYDQCVSTSV